ncbi:unnamed protein product [Vicia faba]|uniref:Uncharacterized protein n=1 Tax=Vicia faba TaxID=3906 RepID=A0AAV1BAM3_VICFA|nr:unnamed protein product [Vicia faba]
MLPTRTKTTIPVVVSTNKQLSFDYQTTTTIHLKTTTWSYKKGERNSTCRSLPDEAFQESCIETIIVIVRELLLMHVYNAEACTMLKDKKRRWGMLSKGAILQVNEALGMEDLMLKWKLEEGFVLNICELAATRLSSVWNRFLGFVDSLAALQ